MIRFFSVVIFVRVRGLLLVPPLLLDETDETRELRSVLTDLDREPFGDRRLVQCGGVLSLLWRALQFSTLQLPFFQNLQTILRPFGVLGVPGAPGGVSRFPFGPGDLPRFLGSLSWENMQLSPYLQWPFMKSLHISTLAGAALLLRLLPREDFEPLRDAPPFDFPLRWTVYPAF